MRYIVYSLLVIVLVDSSCQKKVLDIKPKDILYNDLAFSTPEKIEAATIAGYDGLQNYQFLAGRALLYVDAMGEDIIDRGQTTGDINHFGQLSNSAFAASVWSAGYDAIGRANRTLSGIMDNSDKLNPTKAKELIAECKFVRAVANFYLVNFYAQPYGFTLDASHPGIPLITVSYTSNDPDANKPRASVGAVYTAIIDDLTAALADLPVSYPNVTDTVYNNKTRGTKAAAASFLSRVYLYKGDYSNAKKYALDVINGMYGTFALNSTVDGAFGPTHYMTKETIWSIPNNSNDNPSTNYSLPQNYNALGRADLAVSPTFLDTVTNRYFGKGDKRRSMIVTGVGTYSTLSFTTKYPDINSRADWAPIIRYPEVLLTYAEAQARTATGIDGDAVAKLNVVRDRAKADTTLSYTVNSFYNNDSLIAAILGERRIELAFEGHRFWDLMRIKATVTNKYDSDGQKKLSDQPFGAQKNIFPIPQLEVDKSKKVLAQNEGY
ncbi:MULTISPECIES: RagB/SusD family nutrient uptake outer membrane protein [Niastella]|uniref:RagB/SusD family nutrient uptake outer membrane protein n=1 Tax=Niastella soli TaxID=2821487 RepID=A0ABS3YMY8_9BACT|nr:RagB/SusD family nutrient uptake outer membrane protein [Niastella soli]MBO9199183.1 RagB/SusD family nutrient uptake outer membrane protein [Niastella soli]